MENLKYLESKKQVGNDKGNEVIRLGNTSSENRQEPRPKSIKVQVEVGKVYKLIMLVLVCSIAIVTRKARRSWASTEKYARNSRNIMGSWQSRAQT